MMKTDEAMPGGKFSIVTRAIADGVMVENINIFTCQKCKMSMTGLTPAEAHLQGTKHKKALQVSKIEIKEENCLYTDSINNSVQTAIMSGQVFKKQEGTQKLLICVPCNKQCTGELPMMQHLSSEVHAKTLKQEAYRSSLSFSTENTSISSTSTIQCALAPPADIPSVEGDDALAQAVREGTVQVAPLDSNHLQCLVCKTFCTGEINMKQHLLGKSHHKYLKLNGFLAKRSVGSPSPSVTSLYAPPQLKDDMAHKDMLSGKREFSLVSGDMKKGSMYESTVSKVTCNNLAEMSSHLQGYNHRNQCRIKESGDTPESETSKSTLPVAFPTLKDKCATVIPPPLQFEDAPPCMMPGTEEMDLKESGLSLTKMPFDSSSRKHLDHALNKNQMEQLPNMRIYRAKDDLSDLFD